MTSGEGFTFMKYRWDQVFAKRNASQSRDRGFSLIEMVVALSLSTILGISVTSIVVWTVNLTARSQANAIISGQSEKVLTGFETTVRDSDQIISATRTQLVYIFQRLNFCEEHTYTFVTVSGVTSLTHIVRSAALTAGNYCSDITPTLLAGTVGTQTTKLEATNLDATSGFTYYSAEGQRTFVSGETDYSLSTVVPPCLLGSVTMTLITATQNNDRSSAAKTETVTAGIRTNTFGLTCSHVAGFMYFTSGFLLGSNSTVLPPTLTDGTVTRTTPPGYAITSGVLPPGVTFNTTTGEFTGPISTYWNFKSSVLAKSSAIGSSFTCTVTSSPVGGAKCWGLNANGQLGSNGTTNSSIPLDVTGLTSGVARIATGGAFACAVTTGGGVKCWGLNSNGQLGNGTLTQSLTPVDVTGLSSGVSELSGGTAYMCALMVAGTVKCWGDNGYGQLGNDSTVRSSVPVDVLGLTGVTVLAGGDTHICAVANGGAKCWGNNTYGDDGDNNGNGGGGGQNMTDAHIPVDVLGLTSGVIDISAGLAHSCAVTSSGAVWCWGYNSTGQLGINPVSNNYSHTAVQVPSLTSGVSKVTAGSGSTCITTLTGSAKCWGDNTYGQLGNNSQVTTYIPVQVSGLTSGIAEVQSGPTSVCALSTYGTISCWGHNTNGQAGNGTLTTPLLVPTVVYKNGGQAGFPVTLTVTKTDTNNVTTSITVVLTAF
jgi:prepilin-type N-terminal cleavage/methylation domain-containing protein